MSAYVTLDRFPQIDTTICVITVMNELAWEVMKIEGYNISKNCVLVH
jgi:hypothetical protein